MGKRTVTQQRGKKEREKIQGNKKHMLGGKRIQFPERVGGSTENKATRWQHSWGSYYLSSYTVTFVWRF